MFKTNIYSGRGKILFPRRTFVLYYKVFIARAAKTRNCHGDIKTENDIKVLFFQGFLTAFHITLPVPFRSVFALESAPDVQDKHLLGREKLISHVGLSFLDKVFRQRHIFRSVCEKRKQTRTLFLPPPGWAKDRQKRDFFSRPQSSGNGRLSRFRLKKSAIIASLMDGRNSKRGTFFSGSQSESLLTHSVTLCQLVSSR